jgi:transglutaminase-like putative cysteine protease
MNPRLTITAAIAVAAASLSLNAVIQGNGWLFAGLGAIICVALTGSLTRLSGPRSTIGVSLLVLIAVMPLISGPYLWLKLLLAALWVALIGTVAASGRLHWIATLVAYLAVLLVYFNLVFAHGESRVGFIPTSKSMAALAALPRQAVSAFHYKPPVQDVMAVSFFAAVGIGLVAVLVDIFAVWLRRPALAGLPLLALFSVPVASNLTGFNFGQSLIFAIGLAGFLLLLATDGRQRLRMWGRLVSFRYVQPPDEAGPGPDTRDIAASGRRIGLAAVCIAIVVPLVLPTMHVHDLFATSGGGTGPGSGPGGSVPLNPLLKIQQDLVHKAQPVLTYTTNFRHTDQQYLQMYALNYNAPDDDWVPVGAAKSNVKSSGKLPDRVPGLQSSTLSATVTTRVKMDSGLVGDAVIAAPYAPVKIFASGSWQEQAQSLTVSSSQPMSGLKYTVISDEPYPTPTELGADSLSQSSIPPSIMHTYTAYKGQDASVLKGIADQAIGDSKTEFAKALALETFFVGTAQFSYSLHPGLPSSPAWLLKFLQKVRSGDCQQFSWAFAVLARLLGIPTRIAVGYTAGTHVSGSTWRVTTADAHAWPEVYFPKAGWVRFEPTPSGAGGQNTATLPDYATAPPPSTNVGKTKVGPTRTSKGNAPPSTGNKKGKCVLIICVKNRVHDSAGGGPAPRPGPGFPWAITLPVIIVVLVAWPGLARIATRRRRWLAASSNAGLAHAAWREMADDLADYGFVRQPSESPRALVRRIAASADLQDSAREAVRRIGRAEERARYALSVEPGAGLRADVRTVRRALATHTPWPRRIAARLFPASTLTAALHALQRATEMFGWLDTSWPSMRQIRRSMANRSSEAAG